MIGASISLKNARMLLIETQELFMNDKENPDLIQNVKTMTFKVFKWRTIEEQNLRQRSKIDWLRLGMLIIGSFMLKSRPSRIKLRWHQSVVNMGLFFPIKMRLR